MVPSVIRFCCSTTRTPCFRIFYLKMPASRDYYSFWIYQNGRPSKRCQLKKTHNLKVENYVLFEVVIEDCSHSLSDSSEELFQRGKEGARLYSSFCLQKKKKKHIAQHQKIIVNHKKTQTSEVNDFSAFLYMGRCKSQGSLKVFLWYAS